MILMHTKFYELLLSRLRGRPVRQCLGGDGKLVIGISIGPQFFWLVLQGRWGYPSLRQKMRGSRFV